jgi:hypothetical protein
MSNSIGDLRNSGLQGNNWPWQYKVLKGLDCICDGIDQLAPLLGPQTRDANIISETGPGSIPSCYGFSIANVGTAVGLVAGQPLPAGATINFDPNGLNNTINGIGYDATGTTFLITWLS